ncbi:MAG TPA: LLM class flavin-dependent oxidoreductase [Alphaproteobacteria bacterium]|nr:LLM class flavin-dependent oxidoreductase [Alphaproteobacteria bacterium]
MHVGMATGFAHQRGDDYSDAEFMQDELRPLLLAEDLGFDSIWITEHHFDNYSISPNPIQTLTYLAARTKRVRLSTQVTVAPWHDPVRLAEQFIVLDHLSGGRAMAGFGRGLARREYEGFRVDLGKSRELFDEIVELVMNALNTGIMEGGALTKQPRVELRPRPLRSFRGRAFVAATTPDSQRAAAKLGMGRMYITLPSANSALPATAIDHYAEAWREFHPKEPKPGPFVSGMIVVDESGDRAREIAAKHAAVTFAAAVKHYEMDSPNFGKQKGYEYYSQARRDQGQADSGRANQDGTTSGTIAGTPQQVLEQYENIKNELGAQGLFPHLYFGAMPQDEAYRNLMLFAKKCLPEIKSWRADTTIDQPLRAAAE